MTLLPALWMAPVELLLPSIWAVPKWSGAGWRLQWRWRRGGEPAPAGEEKAWGRACAGKGGAAWGQACADRGGVAWGKASAGTGGERRGGRPVPADAAGDGGERVVGERADPFCCSIRFDEENIRQR